ncbi:hypothetical protein BBK82_14045 [Lentzea guizhouensis]|uniref:Uncharacterized protein n=1 Tax=Lentzea guizhouensis TaxID=1586287 RepID=A0A1B2HH25_9PSEU|nr:hypothetical protein [Lentzea guizhouensis]ANZ37024.1 hypothetical protein BBK82_14045 [Lentzea guizhouensis]
MAIEDELRQLFKDDERLDLHVSSRAEETVVRGAKRRRQRRSAAAGAFAVVALIGAGVGLVQLRHAPLNTDMAGPSLSTSQPSTSTPAPSTTVITETVTVPAGTPPTGGNNSGNNNSGSSTSTKKSTGTSAPPRTPDAVPPVYNKLTLAMTEADALKTGMLVEGQPQPDEPCKGYAMTSVDDPKAVIISAARGIVRITLPQYVKTSKQIGSGSSVADLKAAYPTAAQNGSELVVQMNTAPKWLYVFENDGTTVQTVRMRLADNDCAGA